MKSRIICCWFQGIFFFVIVIIYDLLLLFLLFVLFPEAEMVSVSECQVVESRMNNLPERT